MKKHYIPLMLAFLFALTSFAQTPGTSAPNPVEDPANVVSIYSDTYTDLAIANYDPNWGQSGHTLVNTTFDPTGGGTDFVLAYPNFNYQGTDFGFNEDLSGMDFLHVDIWVEAGTDRMVKISPISNGAGPIEVLVEVPLTPGSWNSVTLDKADFAGMGWESIYQLKFDGQFNGDGSANTTPFDIYLDNIYFSQTPVSAPANDECADAVSLTVNPDFGCGTTTSATIADATDSGVDNCGGTEDDDVWFTFVATDTTHKVDLLNITGGTSDLYHAVYDGTPGCGTLGAALTCSDPNSSTTSGLTIGNTYYVQVYSWTSTPGQTSSFDICIGTPPPPPANDDCNNAIGLTVNPDFGCGVTTAGTILSATDSGEDNCGGTEDDDVWFSFVATDTTHKVDLLNITGGTSDLYHAVYDGTSGCGSLGNAFTCSDPNSSTTSGLTIGNTYYVQVYSWTSTPGQSSSFDICIGTPPPPPVNDDLCGAIPLTMDASSTGDQYTNNSATAQANEPLPGCFSNGIDRSVWFTFDAPASGEVTVTTDIAGGTLTDTEVAVYDAPADCTDLTTLGIELGCDQDGGSVVNFNSIVDLTGLTPGATYYVQVDSWSNTASGTFGISVLDANPPTSPTTSAPVPTEDAANVVSIYSDTYTDLAIGNYDPNWGQSGHMQVNTTFDPTGAGTDFVLAYPNFNYQGTDFGFNEDLSDMDFLHVDIWVQAGTDRMVKVSPINNGTGAGEVLVEVPVTPGSWNSVTLDKADFAGMTWDSIFQLKFDGQFNADGSANGTPFDIYLDNIYFSQTPPVTGTTLAGPFNVTNPNITTVNVNDAVNSAGFSPLLYDSFEISADWTSVSGGPWSSEGEMQVNTVGGVVDIDPPTSGGANNGNDTTLIFSGDFSTLYDPATDGTLFLELSQSFGSSSADWSNIVVTLFEAPSCPDLTGLAVSSAGPDSATLNWDDSALATDGYTWSVYTSPSDPSTDTAVATGTVAAGINTAQATGLSPQTDYDFYLIADCGASNGSSLLAGPVAFTTACSVFVAPYTEDFNADPSNIPNCWSQGAANAENWLFRDTPIGHIGNVGSFPNTSASAGGFAWVDDSGSHNTNTRLESPFIDVSGLTVPTLSFYYISDNEGDANGNVDFSVEVWDGTTWNQVFFSNQNSPNAEWTQVFVDISPLTITSDIQLAFIIDENNGTGFDDDVAIDDVSVIEAPSCFAPTNLVAANITSSGLDLSWDAAASEVNGYEWVVMNSGDAPDVATAVATGAVGTGVLTANISGLPASSALEAYVRTDCGGDGISAWSAILSFDTLCDVFVAPFNEDFNADPSNIPNCWAQGAANAESWLFRDTPTGHIGNNGSFPNSSASGGGFAWVDDSSPHNTNTRLESPPIDVSGLTVPALSFYYISDNEGDANGNVDFSVEVWDGAAWNQVFFSNQNSPNAEWTEVIVDISTLAITGDIQLAFIIDENNAGGFDDDVAIDDISVDEAPACLKPVNLTASNIDLTTADVSWDPVTSATNGYLWSLFAAGEDPLVDTPLDSGTTDAVTTSVNLSGLTEATDYDFYVESDCGADGTSGLSAPLGFSTLTPGLNCATPLSATVTPFGDNSQPITFDTTDLPDMASVPSCEGFDSTEQGFWYEFTTNATAGITLSLLAGDVGDIEGAIYDSCGGTELFCFADGNSQDFTSDVLVFGLAPATTYILQVYTESFNEGTFTLAITDLPSCPSVQNLSATASSDTAQLSWDEEPNASNGYTWELYTSPSDPAVDTPVDSGSVAFGTNSVSVSGLLAETDYDFYVTADCDTDGTSSLAGPGSFTTDCAPFALNFEEDFTSLTSNVNTSLNCWAEGDGIFTDVGSSGWGSQTFNNDSANDNGNGTSLYVNLYNSGGQDNDFVTTPAIDLGAGDPNYILSYDVYVRPWSSTAPLPVTDMGPHSVSVVISTDGGVTWDLVSNTLTTYDTSNIPNDLNNTLETISLGSYSGVIKLGFLTDEDGTAFDFRFYIDNLYVGPQPPPANDNLCDAIPLTVGAPTTPDAYSNVAATAEPNEPVPGCFADGINGSVWFTFVAPASGDVTVTTDIAGSTSDDTEIAVYDAPTDCTDLTTLGTDLGCDQDSGTVVNFNSILSLSALTPGNTYYIQVDIWSFTGNTNLAFGEFGIRVLDNNPPCPEPTNLNVTNILTDSADLNWDDVVEATTGYDWSVYASPSNPATDTPVASGTVGVGVNTANVSGLMSGTDYDFYVSSDCDTDGTSTLAGPVTFRTAETVDCASGTPVNVTVCYDDDQDLQYAFISTDGTPLRVSFIEGYFEDCCDDIIIYDGLTTADPVLFASDTNFNNDATGIEAVSTGDSILVRIDSDGSVSCGSGAGSPALNFDVSCISTDELDYYNMQWPPNGNITIGDQFDVFAQAYEAGLTDASDSPAAGIESWIGYSSADSSPDTAADWTWVAAAPNAGFDFTQNNDEYTLNLGAEIAASGTYYYASRWRLNGGPFTYGGIAPDGSGGGEWGTGGFASGVLTVNNPPPPVNDEIANATPINVDESFCDGTNTNATNEWATGGAEAPGTCFNGANADNDVWFTFVGPANTTFVNVSTDFTGGTLVDTEMSVYSGTPGNLVELACSQDDGVTVLSNGFSWNSLITDLAVTPGETYYVQVAGYGTTATGTFCLDISTACTTDAGTLTADADPVDLIGGTATISATEDTAPTVPTGYSTLYVLTSGPSAVIEQTNALPTFDVTAAGDYTIHTLVYNPATLDLSIVTPGVTLASEVDALLIQGGGSICASLDLIGAPITVNATASVQIIHNSADPVAEFVDIYVDGVLELANVQFRTASPFIGVPSGAPVDIDVALAGSTGVGDSVYNFNTTFVEGVSYILVADGVTDPTLFDTSVNSSIAFGFELISGVVQTSLNPGDTSILVHHGSTDAPTVDVVETSVPLGTVADDISYTDFTTYTTVPTADYVLNVELADNSAVVASYEANLATLGTSDLAITVLASGFLDPAANQNGPAFGLWAALPTGGALIELPFIEPAPMTPAPDPTEDPLNVISMFSGVYTDVPVDTWLTSWSQAQLADIQIQGNDTKLYTNLDFAGIETVANPIDASGMDFFHIDVWSPNATTFRVKLVDFSTGGPIEGEIAFNIPQQQWVSLQIPLVDFADPALVTNSANLLTSTTSIQQLIISGLPVGAVTAYVDNVYFSSTTVGTTQFDSNNFNFYPNPARNVINLETSSQVEQVRIYNMLGQQVLVETPNTVSPRLNVETLQTGTYIMNVTIDGASKNFKFVKE